MRNRAPNGPRELSFTQTTRYCLAGNPVEIGFHLLRQYICGQQSARRKEGQSWNLLPCSFAEIAILHDRNNRAA